MSESRTFHLPDHGEGLTEALIEAVLVSPGDRVEQFAVIFQVETEKAVVDVTCPWGGHRLRGSDCGGAVGRCWRAAPRHGGGYVSERVVDAEGWER